MREHCEGAAQQIEHDKSNVPHGIFDVVAEDPKIEHVADQVHPAAVQEHRGHHRERRRTEGDVGVQRGFAEQGSGYRAESVYDDLLTARIVRDLPQEDEHARDDEADRDDGSDPRRVVVAQRNHVGTDRSCRVRAASYPITVAAQTVRGR